MYFYQKKFLRLIYSGIKYDEICCVQLVKGSVIPICMILLSLSYISRWLFFFDTLNFIGCFTNVGNGSERVTGFSEGNIILVPTDEVSFLRSLVQLHVTNSLRRSLTNSRSCFRLWCFVSNLTVQSWPLPSSSPSLINRKKFFGVLRSNTYEEF